RCRTGSDPEGTAPRPRSAGRPAATEGFRPTMSRTTLRPATPDDLSLLRHWDRQPHVAAARGDDGEFDWAAELPRPVDWRALLIGEVDGRAVGFIQIIDPDREETRYWGETGPGLQAIDIWIGEEADIGRGHGTAMMRLALARCFAAPGVEAVLVDPLAANTRAHRFYERLGFRRVERRRFGTDDCLVLRLERRADRKSTRLNSSHVKISYAVFCL